MNLYSLFGIFHVFYTKNGFPTGWRAVNNRRQCALGTHYFTL
jgi:hypothetical protein